MNLDYLCAEVDTLLALDNSDMKQRRNQFLEEHENRILELPFSENFNDYKALLNLYLLSGALAIAKEEYSDAIHFYEKSIVILGRARYLLVSFADVFLYLTKCYVELGMPQNAKPYFEKYLLYRPADHETYQELCKMNSSN